jgi:hypothetical protein
MTELQKANNEELLQEIKKRISWSKETEKEARVISV